MMTETIPETYDAQAELDAAWCDQCGIHHGGPCYDSDDIRDLVIEHLDEAEGRTLDDIAKAANINRRLVRFALRELYEFGDIQRHESGIGWVLT